MYSVKGDGITIYNDTYLTESVKGLNPKLTLKDNSAGSFEITLPPGNAGYDTLERLSSEIVVYRDNVEIWSGRIIKEKKDFMNNRILTCEGELAYLNDTTQPPNEYVERSILQFLTALLTEHNNKVGTDKQFKMGAVNGWVNETISCFTNNESTLEVINNQLIERFGGHLIIEKKVDGRYLHYVEEYPNTPSQEIRFGENLLDFTRNWDMTKLATVITPKGAPLEEPPEGWPEGLDAYVDVKSVNGGSPYVTSEAAISEFGWIEAVVDWPDVDDPAELLSKAQLYLQDAQFVDMVIDVSAVDLRYLNKDIESINLLDQVRCISRPHGMDRLFPVSELNIQLDKPENSTYVLGSIVKENTLSGSIKSGNADIINKINNIPKVNVEKILDTAFENATDIMNSKTRGIVTITQNAQGSQSLVISSDNTYDPITDLWSTQTKLWRWNINGFAFSSDGGRSFSNVAITMDGAISANAITTGTMSADRVRTGILQSQDGNVVWNLNSGGSLTIKRGEIRLGTGGAHWSGSKFYVDEYGDLWAEEGKIGGFTISSYSIYNDSIELDGAGIRFTVPKPSPQTGLYQVGRMGTLTLEDEPEKYGMLINLELESSYISFGQREEEEEPYMMKLFYAGINNPPLGYKADRWHLGTYFSLDNYGFEGTYGSRVYQSLDWVVSSSNNRPKEISLVANLRIGSSGNVISYEEFDCCIINGVIMRQVN
jgi:hypothetical protein